MTIYIGKPAELGTSGPVLAVKLAPSRYLHSTVPPLATLARIDTGMPYTLIHEGVATQLGLTPHRTALITTPTRYTYKSDVYRIRVEFPHGYAVELPAAEVPYMVHDEVHIKCILGLGFLSLCTFTYDGTTDTFSLTFKE
jgi:predicted aspartyl protease